MAEQLALLPEYLTAHLQLTLIALTLSILVSVPVGIVATRVHWLERFALSLASVVQTVPSLALLALMVPVLSALELQSIGILPALIGLTLYGVLPILRNTVTGLSGIDPHIKEAARGVGMTPRQQLMMVELPLAMPVIIAGIRTATVWTVGTATLSTPIGATSLGNYIFSGLQTRNYSAVLVGCIAAAGLALSLDGMVRSIETSIANNSRRRLIATLGFIAILFAYASITVVRPFGENTQRPIIIGAKTFTEQYILSEALSEWIEQETGRRTTLMQSLGSVVAFDALDEGDIDVYVDYSGTIWANEMARGRVRASRTEVLNDVRQFLKTEHGVSLAAVLGFENSYALAVRTQDARRLGLRTISDLSRHDDNLSIGGDYEFFVRPEWRALQDQYNLMFSEQRTMDPTLMYQAIAAGNVDVISAFSSDGRISSYGLEILEDDQNAIPPYDAIVLVGARLVREMPSIISVLSTLNNTIDANQMRELNLQVDEQGNSPQTAALAYINQLRATVTESR
ncbi:MAG: ABC transporter permease/substrate-binding protein [Acidobacteriota bacterium]|nr:ABC transporter permease/substrate-binding protein [Acidobacteriota bacterium]